jgi:hypothetical protein
VIAVAKTWNQARMQKDVRNWGLGLIGIGVLSLILSPMSQAWGVVLVIAGLASFIFRETAILAVYGVLLAWAAISNLASGQLAWIGFALFQAFACFITFSRYAEYRRNERARKGKGPWGPHRAGRSFPQIGCALSALAILGLAVALAAAFAAGIYGTTDGTGWVTWLESLATGLAVLGLAAGVASLLSGFERRTLAVLAVAACGLVIVFELVFLVFAALG